MPIIKSIRISGVSYDIKDSRRFGEEIVLLSTDWDSNNTIEVDCSNITPDSTIILSPTPESVEDYIDSKIYCTNQGQGTLMFRCTTTPNDDIYVNTLIFN